MVIGYTQVTLGGQTLQLRSVSKREVPGTVKQKIGGNLIKHKIPARSIRDLSISGRGQIFDDTQLATTGRTALEALNDVNVYTYSDGLVTASVIIEDLTFDDTEENPLSYTYSIRMIEYNQA
jgi:hypothetical protein